MCNYRNANLKLRRVGEAGGDSDTGNSLIASRRGDSIIDFSFLSGVRDLLLCMNTKITFSNPLHMYFKNCDTIKNVLSFQHI